MSVIYSELAGKVTVVTGGASGIGYATAKKLGECGAKVVLADYNQELAQSRAADLSGQGVKAVAFKLDVSQPQEVAALFEFTRQEFGPVQILVNSAGIVGPNKPATEVGYTEWQNAIGINLTGTFLCCQAALQDMLKAGNGGRIVNVASIAGKEGNPNLTAYSASKGGVIALTKSLAKEVAGKNILINAIAPAVIDTPINRDTSAETLKYMISRIPLGRVGQPEEVAEMISWMTSDACSFTTGFCFDLSGGRATY